MIDDGQIERWTYMIIWMDTMMDGQIIDDRWIDRWMEGQKNAG